MRQLAASGDWDGFDVLSGAILGLAEGEGKGRGSATGDGRAKRSSPKSAGKGGDGFDGNCYHCGAHGHRQDQW